jgi:type I restriction enzyme S subunit
MEKLNNIPVLRFPEFKGDWELKKFGDVANFKVTNSFSRDNLNYDNGIIKNIHYGDIHTKFQTLFDITKETVPFINEEISINRISEDFYCQEGDIIFADASEDLNDVGKSVEIVNLNNEKLLSGLHTLLARPIEKTFKIGFNGYLFKSNTVRIQIQKESQGSKVLSINVGRISGIEISFPNIPEQTKIANFLTSVDEKLQVLKQKKTLLEQYKKGVMQKIFSQQIRFKDENGDDFEDWEEKTLGEIANKIGDGLHGTPVYSVTSDIYFINGNNLTNGKIEISENTKKVDYNIFTKNDKKLNSNTILISLNGTIGNISRYNNEKVMLGKSVGYFNFKENVDFYYHVLKTETTQNFFVSALTGSTIKNLSLKTLRETKIPLPCLEEQTKIANFLSIVDDKINHCQEQIANTEVWKKGLLQRLFI